MAAGGGGGGGGGDFGRGGSGVGAGLGPMSAAPLPSAGLAATSAATSLGGSALARGGEKFLPSPAPIAGNTPLPVRPAFTAADASAASAGGRSSRSKSTDALLSSARDETHGFGDISDAPRDDFFSAATKGRVPSARRGSVLNNDTAGAAAVGVAAPGRPGLAAAPLASRTGVATTTMGTPATTMDDIFGAPEPQSLQSKIVSPAPTPAAAAAPAARPVAFTAPLAPPLAASSSSQVPPPPAPQSPFGAADEAFGDFFGERRK
jgi:hypothetical protein